MGLTALFPSERVVLWTFITIKNLSSLAGFEPVNLGSSGMHTNYLTTEGDMLIK